MKDKTPGIKHEAEADLQEDIRDEIQKKNDEDHLRDEISLIGKMTEEELDEAELTEQL